METNQNTPGIKKLEDFIGKWHHEGTSYGEGQDVNNPEGNPKPWISDESYEWLPGNFFVLHKWTAKTGETPFIGTEIIGYNEQRNEFYSYFFDNGGNHPVYTITEKNREWSFFEPFTRATQTFEDKDTISIRWEWKHDGSDWLPLCNRVAKRVS